MNLNFWKRPFSSYVFLWMALGLMSLTILLMAGALMSRERDRWVNHSLEVLQHLERYEANVIAAQVRVRDMVPWTDPGPDGKLAESGLLIAQRCVATMLELTEDN